LGGQMVISTSRKRVPGLVRGRMRDGDGVGFGASTSSDSGVWPVRQQFRNS